MKASHLIYAVGDVHGCFDLMQLALDKVRRHARGRSREVVLLGDYVDRGLKSRQTVDTLMALNDAGEIVCLRGNHEDMVLRVFEDPNAQTIGHWFENGGRATAGSYGSVVDFYGNIPPEHLAWFRGLPLIVERPQHIFVHAGLDPFKPLVEQSAREFIWIRERFLNAAPEDFLDKRHIVHGHTPVWRNKPEAQLPELLPHRTNLDTGAYATGVLSIGVFDPRRRGGPVDVLFAT